MHRSGTSALTRVFNLLGADLPKSMMGGGAGNELGHWEPVDLVNLHDEMLSSMGSNWHDWRAIDPEWNESSTAEAFKSRLLAGLKSDYGDSPLFVVKDPRICRFVPLWREVLERYGAPPQVVMTLRNPLEVAASLRERDGFLAAKSLLLWLRHALDAERDTRDLPRALVTYDGLMTDWREVASAVAASTDIRWPRRSDRAELEIERFLSSKHRHHVVDPQDLAARRAIVDWVNDAHAALLAMSRGNDTASQQKRLDGIRREFDKAASAFGLVLADESERAGQLQQDAARLHDELAASRRAADDREAVLAEERERSSAALRERDALLSHERERSVAALQERETLLVQEREQSSAALAVAQTTLARATEDVARLNAAVAEAVAAGRQHEQQTAQLTRDLDAARGLLRESQTDVQKLAGELDGARNEAAHASAKLVEAEGLLQRKDAQIDQASVEVAAARVEIQFVKANFDRATQEMAEQAAETVRLQQALDAANANAAKSQGAMQAAEAMTASLKQRLAASEAETTRLQQALAASAAETAMVHAEAKRQTAGLVAALEERNASIERERAEVVRLSDTLAAVRKTADDGQREVQQLKSMLDNEKRAHSTSAEAAAARLDAVRGETSRRQAEDAARIADLSNQARAAAEQAKQIRDERDGLRRAQEEARSRHWRARLGRLLSRSGRSRAALRREYELIRASKLFDALWYLKRYPDVAAAGVDPLHHYIRFGSAEGRDPHPLFDGKWYAAQAGGIADDIAASGLSALGHYVSLGVARGLDPNPLFDTDWYLSQNPDVAAAGVNPLHHFWKEGAARGFDPNPLFDTSWYLERNPDVARAGENALLHYIEHGWREGREPGPEFDAYWYLSTHHDVAKTRMNPLRHYLVYGQHEGRSIRTLETRNPVPVAASDLTSLDSKSRLALPSPLLRLLDMFHDDSARIPLERCYDMIACYDGVDVSEEFLFKCPELRVFVHDVSRLSNSRGRVAPCKVSIVIPVFNKLLHTLCCVYSILALTKRADFEIVIADDCSTDATPTVFSGMGGKVRLVRHEQNLGFLKNCNAAVERCQGEIIVLLNNDTLVLPNWLEELVQLLDREEQIGLVGSKLINMDGTLQEAGGIVWEDASAWNFGRGGDPCASQYNYVKDVDYISGASIALTKLNWNRLGGFDEIFTPAYCEDTDLAFRTRAMGLRTVYQPRSAVIHHEGASHGRDVTQGVKSYQVRNNQIFFERWKQTLAKENYPNGTNVIVARDRSRGRPRILVVDHYPPQPDRDAGSRTIYSYLELFAKSGFHVSFWPHNLFFDRDYTPMLQYLGIETFYGRDDTWPSFDDWLEHYGRHLNYVLLSRPTVAADFVDKIREKTSAKILFYGHDIHCKRLEMEFKITGNAEIIPQIEAERKTEESVWTRSDVVYYPSDEERDFIKGEYPSVVVYSIPPYLIDRARLARTRARLLGDGISKTKTLLFVAGFRHRPNVDAAQWFVQSIWPQVIAAVPEAQLYLVGSEPPPEVRGLSGSNITVTGAVSDPDLAAIYQQTAIAVVPLRYGAGVKGKLIEALSYGIPVVTTSVGTQGVPDAEKIADISDDAEQFADRVVMVLRDPEQKKNQQLRGVEYVEQFASEMRAKQILGAEIRELVVD
jgi:GT2 family glycosyltransferase